MSRAFVREGDAEEVRAREGAEHEKKFAEHLKLQRKKLEFLKSERGDQIDPEKRARWIAEIEELLSK